jgi:hypothetical protein
VNNSNISLVPLQQANLCLDCEAITTGHTNCLCCGSQALLNIARILNERAAHVQMAKSPIPVCLSSTRQRNVSGMESSTGYLNRAPGEPLRFPLQIAENRV